MNERTFLLIRDDSYYLLMENLPRHNVCALGVVILLRAIHHQFCDLLYPSKDHKLENSKTQWSVMAFSYVTWRRARLTEINTYRLKRKANNKWYIKPILFIFIIILLKKIHFCPGFSKPSSAMIDKVWSFLWRNNITFVEVF